MKLYKHLSLEHANKIIILKNRGLSNYKINKLTGISKEKIRHCLKLSEVEHRRIRVNQQWKGVDIKYSYSFKIYREQKRKNKLDRAYNYAVNAQTIYALFTSFCNNLFNTKVLGKRVKRSVDEYIKEFKKCYPKGDHPQRSWVYEMAKSIHYDFKKSWLPKRKWKVMPIKSDEEASKPRKYNPIEKRPDKTKLRLSPGNFEIDSVIGKRTDKTALLTLIDIHTGDFYIRKYDRKAKGFSYALNEIMMMNDLRVNTLTMDNGGENNLLHTVVDESKLYNCHAYCSGEKGTLENKHRLIRRIIKKGESIDTYTQTNINVISEFVNNYYSKRFNRI